MYENGKGVAQDYTEAVKWYRKAAEQGNTAMRRIQSWSEMYENGKSVAQDPTQKRGNGTRKAAEQGHSASAKQSRGIVLHMGEALFEIYQRESNTFILQRIRNKRTHLRTLGGFI